jgi:hypothetical protein
MANDNTALQGQERSNSAKRYVQDRVPLAPLNTRLLGPGWLPRLALSFGRTSASIIEIP